VGRRRHLRTLHRMAGGTLRRPGLGGTVEDLPGQPWIAGQRVAASGSYGPTVAWLPRWAARTRCSGSDDAVASRAPIALACKSERINGVLASNPTPHTLVNPGRLCLCGDVVGAENFICAVQGAWWYSWRMPSSRSCRRMVMWSSRSDSVMGWGSWRGGVAACRARCVRWSL
jgi:hypothetical protein